MQQEPINTIIDPVLLKATPRRAALRVFLCGPGMSHPIFQARKHIREYLDSVENVTVTYGEELLDRETGRKGDLQTVENAEADQSDFTILLVDSPGSIAELGCFSTSEFLRHRLFAIIPQEYYASNGYIARGPLSVLARQFQSSVIYYERRNFSALTRAVMVPVAMFKFIAAKYGRYYRPYLDQQKYKDDSKKYIQRFLNDRREFLNAYTLAAINIADEPTFTDLVSLLHVSPIELRDTLKQLFKSESIRKRAGKYVPLKGYSDPAIHQLSSTAISLRRAARFAVQR